LFVTGIIAEFNPLHNGHKYLIEKAKEKGPVVCVLSGNFVQRGETAIAEKRVRTKAALLCGADLVLELPVLWSMSTAQNFALGGVSALGYAGCDGILFGSEKGDISELKKAAEILQSEKYLEILDKEISKGVTFAAARQISAEKCGLEKGILEGANNNLGIEYIIAAKKLGFNLEYDTIARLGSGHDSKEESDYVSASFIREKIKENQTENLKKYMPEKVVELLSENNISHTENIERLILGTLRTRTLEDLKKLPDISEGIENKLFDNIRLAGSLEELYNGIKVKRYTLARIRRLVLSAFLGADNTYFMKPLPYIRVLGFNKTGKELLASRLAKAPVPVITKTRDINNLDTLSKKVFNTECRATDLFGLSLNNPIECGLEYTSKMITLE